MLLYSSRGDMELRLQTARRVFTLMPSVIFFFSLLAFAVPASQSTAEFTRVLLQSIAISLASSFVCIAAYGFYRYLVQRSPGL